MKIAATVAKVLLGLIYVVFGFNMLVVLLGIMSQPPISPPPMTGEPAAFLGLLVKSKFLLFVKILEVSGGVLLLASIFLKKYAPLGLVLLTPVTVSIFLFHFTFQGLADAGMAIVMLVLTGVIVKYHWASFSAIFAAHE